MSVAIFVTIANVNAILIPIFYTWIVVFIMSNMKNLAKSNFYIWPLRGRNSLSLQVSCLITKLASVIWVVCIPSSLLYQYVKETKSATMNIFSNFFLFSF